MFKEDVGHKFLRCLEQLSWTYLDTYVLTKHVPFFVYSSLGLDLVDSMDTLLAYGFGASILFFSSHKVVVSSCYKLLLWGTNKSR